MAGLRKATKIRSMQERCQKASAKYWRDPETRATCLCQVVRGLKNYVEVKSRRHHMRTARTCCIQRQGSRRDPHEPHEEAHVTYLQWIVPIPSTNRRITKLAARFGATQVPSMYNADWINAATGAPGRGRPRDLSCGDKRDANVVEFTMDCAYRRTRRGDARPRW